MKNIYKKDNIFLRVLYESFLKNTVESGLVFLKHQSLSILNSLVQGFCAFQRIGFLQSVLVGIVAVSVVLSVFFTGAIVLASYDVLVFDAYHLHLFKMAALIAFGLVGVASLLFYVLTSPAFVAHAVGTKNVEDYFDKFTNESSKNTVNDETPASAEPVWSAVLHELTPVLTSILIEWIRQRSSPSGAPSTDEVRGSVESDATLKTQTLSVWLSEQEIDQYRCQRRQTAKRAPPYAVPKRAA